MNEPKRFTKWIVWGGLFIVIAGIGSAFTVSRLAERIQPLPVYRTVPDFTLTNQSGLSVSLGDLRGRVWVADIIFTRCPGPCLRMSHEMAELQTEMPTDGTVQLVSLTADPDFDTASVLNRYGEQFGAAIGRWQFLTGKKLDLYRLATQGLLLAVDQLRPDQRTNPDDLFVHSTLFVVVDGQGRVRASIDGNDVSWREKIMRAVHALSREKQS